jgi:hypothetical protein
VSAAPRDSAVPGAPTVRQPAVAALQAAAAIAAAAGFAFMAVKAWDQIERLMWRPAELIRALSAGVSLATDFPLRFVVLVLGSIGMMLAAEYRPRQLLRVSTVAWASLGVAGTGAYLLSALDVGSRWAFAVLVAAAILSMAFLVRHRPERDSHEMPSGSSAGRALLPILVGLVGGLLAVRASIEPVTEWDAVIYHISYARDWLDALPGLPHAAGPSVGAELSYNYPALFPSVSVLLAGALHLDTSLVARLLSPLAAITVLAVLRSVACAGFFAGWAGSMFLLGSTFFVAYGQWPTAYMLMTLLLTLGVARIATERRLGPATALCIGLAAVTGWIGAALATIVVLGYASWRLGERLRGVAPRSRIRAQSARSVLKVALLAVPLGVVVVSTARRTGALLFPWVTWPHGAHLLPSPYWSATEREILANSYGQFDAGIGAFVDPLVGIAKSGLLAPGGLVVQGVIVAAVALAFVRGRNVLLVGVVAVAASVVLLIVLELVWLRYFLPLIVAAAAGLGAAVVVLHRHDGKAARVAYAGAIVAGCLTTVSGVAYAVAGPNDRTYTATTNYRTERSSAFEDARQAANGRERRGLVYGDDSRAWDDINTLDSAGVGVGTFDARNYYVRYDPRRQLDGLAGAEIKGTTGAEVATQLKSHGIDAVFMPSWFWEPGAARHPLADRSPVALWVGAPALRAARVYLPDANVIYPSVLYAVGSEVAVRRIDQRFVSPTFSVVGPQSTRTKPIRDGFDVSGPLGGPLHWRIAAPVTEIAGPALRVTTTAVRAARRLSVYEPRQPTLVTPAAFVDCTRVAPWARESTLDVAFPGSPLGFALLDLGGARNTRSFDAIVRERQTPAGVLVRACGNPADARGGIFPAGSSASRLILEHRPGRSLALDFDYLDTGRTSVSFNLYDESRYRWVYGVAGLHRCGSGAWVHARLPVDTRSSVRNETVELGPVVTGRDLIVRNLRLVRGSLSRGQTDCRTGNG